MAKMSEGQNIVTASQESLLAAARQAEKSGHADQAAQWQPPYCGEIDMEIRRDGTWFYQGSPIARMGLVKLFARILRHEEGRFYLVSPIEKVAIRVEDAPFIAQDVTATGTGRNQMLRFETNLGDVIPLDATHPLRLVTTPQEKGQAEMPNPYVMVRAGLEARIDRKTFYRLVDLGEAHEHEGQPWFGIWSGGQFWPFIAVSELDLEGR